MIRVSHLETFLFAIVVVSDKSALMFERLVTYVTTVILSLVSFAIVVIIVLLCYYYQRVRIMTVRRYVV